MGRVEPSIGCSMPTPARFQWGSRLCPEQYFPPGGLLRWAGDPGPHFLTQEPSCTILPTPALPSVCAMCASGFVQTFRVEICLGAVEKSPQFAGDAAGGRQLGRAGHSSPILGPDISHGPSLGLRSNLTFIGCGKEGTGRGTLAPRWGAAFCLPGPRVLAVGLSFSAWQMDSLCRAEST